MLNISPKHKLPVLILAILLLATGCSQNTLLTKNDYQSVKQQLIKNNPEEALLLFPKHTEIGTFITAMEKTYLSLLQGKPDLAALEKQVALAENQVKYHVSREASTFFYLHTSEDYYVSEHELIWMHFLLSWGYSLQKKYEAACVEARQASSLLSLPWSPQGHFDDPAMRIFLGTLWSMCGDWKEAQIDFRAAWKMNPKLVWANELAEREQPPADLILVMGGIGPEASWGTGDSANPLRSQRQVKFYFQGQRSQLTLIDNDFPKHNILRTHRTPGATPWYTRHLERESELHELILDSNFGGKATAHGALAGGKIVAHTTAGVLVGIAGTALGVVFLQAGAQASSSDGVQLGLITIAASIGYGAKLAKDGYNSSVKDFKREMDPSNYYRYVRFLPEYFWLGWSDEKIEYPVRMQLSSGDQSMLQQPAGTGATRTAIGFMPDVSVRGEYKYSN